MAVTLCPSCKPHAFQDKQYGMKKRVMNPCKEGKALRCTVCGAEKTVGGNAIEKKRKAS